MTDAFDRLKTALADRYAIERELGAGGMATVYLAQDLKHERQVAVKVLRPELAAVLGAERFLQEIKTTANLQHPHILPLFDSGEADGFLYYVMPFIAGETLRDKLNRETQLGIEEAVKITTEVADALDYAHRNNVIHRDIKPENILLHDGRPVVADFGIALAVSAAAGGRMTETGLSLGTPHYMSPEQATAEKDLTNRSDIYSLGAVLYEMLTGDPPHVGSSAQQIIMKIVTDEPRPVTELRKSVPANVAAATAKALEKLPADRFASAESFAEALENPAYALATTAGVGTVPQSEGLWKRLAIGLAVVTSLVAIWALWPVLQTKDFTGSRPTKLSVSLPPGDTISTSTSTIIAVSPDGSDVVYVARRDTAQQLFLRALDQYETRPIPGTEGARAPFFSPDGEWVGFYAGGSLKRVRLADGESHTIADSVAAEFAGASWGADGTIVLGSLGSGLARVSATGGSITEIIVPDIELGERGHSLPEVLPNGKAVLYTIVTGLSFERTRIGVMSLETGERHVLVESGLQPRYAATGHLVYVNGTSLWALQFDNERLQVLGEPVPVLEDVRVFHTTTAHFSFSRDGTLVYVHGQAPQPADSLVWVDRQGHETLIAVPGFRLNFPHLSPDGRRVALTEFSDSGLETWLLDLARGVLSRFDERGVKNHLQVWTPDGERIVFTSARDGPQNLFWKSADAAGEAQRLHSSLGHKDAGSFSPDGALLAFAQLDPRSDWDIWFLEIDTVPRVRPFLQTPFAETTPMISPDGSWLAYRSDESGRNEVYVTPFPEGGQRWQISATGGSEPLWSRDGRELFYQAGDSMMVVTVGADAELVVGRPILLFRGSYRLPVGYGYPNYDIDADGQRFLMIKPGLLVEGTEQAVIETSPPINVVLNWFQELKERVGNGND